MGDTTKWCSLCRARHPLDAFGVDRTRPDGLRPVCRSAVNRRARARHKRKAQPGPFGPSPQPPRDGDRVQARQRINLEVRTHRRPHPNTLPCVDCGHVWADGERRHEYDHYLGYNAEHHYDVEPVCTTCHARRARERGEIIQTRGSGGRFAAKEVMANG